MVYVFNRLTGEPLYPVQERPVPASTLKGEQAWPTQPYSTLPSLAPLSFTAADVHLHNPDDQKFCVDELSKLENHGLFTPPSIKGTVIFPGSMGGANWGSSAFNPDTGVLYTRVSNMPFLAREVWPPHERLAKFLKGYGTTLPPWAGGYPAPLSNEFRSPDAGPTQSETSPQSGAPYRLVRRALMSPGGTPCAPQPFGSIVAINLNTGKKLWSVAHGEMTKGDLGSVGDGGVIVTAGGLLFAASTNDALLRAYDAATGRVLWGAPLPAPSNATPMAYTIGGRQYVVIAAGGHGFIGKGKSDAVVAFALPETSKKDKRRR
jgi:quinoprotein glucose dehydrogenase